MFQELDSQNLVSFPNCLKRTPQSAVSEQGKFFRTLINKTKQKSERSSQSSSASSMLMLVLQLRCQDEEMKQRRMGIEGLSVYIGDIAVKRCDGVHTP